MIILIIIVFALLGFAVSSRLKSKFRRYSRIPLNSNISGADAAALMLQDHGIYDVQIISVPGHLTDHYNPVNKTINLSEEVYHGRNAAAVAVATHETGHAVQHAHSYAMLNLRSVLVPLQHASAKIINVIFIMSFFGIAFFAFPYQLVLLVIIGCYSIMTLFSLITLPVEFDASKRALNWIENRGLVSSREHEMSKDALHWAAMTYVVSALSSIVMLAYYVFALVGRE